LFYPDIPLRSTITSDGGSSTGFPIENTIAGDRGLLAQYGAAAANPGIFYDLGSGVTASVDFLAVARGDMQYKLNASGYFELRADSSLSATLGNQILYQTPITTLKGPRNEDFYITGTASTAYRYWEFRPGTTSGTVQPYLSKVMFGTAFDFGRDPNYPVNQRLTYRQRGDRAPSYSFDFTFSGVTNTVRSNFISKILAYKDVSSVFLYDRDDLILNGYKILHSRLTNISVTPKTASYNEISFTAEELI
jgi:hypothetical protein